MSAERNAPDLPLPRDEPDRRRGPAGAVDRETGSRAKPDRGEAACARRTGDNRRKKRFEQSCTELARVDRAIDLAARGGPPFAESGRLALERRHDYKIGIHALWWAREHIHEFGF